MQLTQIRLNGFIGIQKGLGVEEVELDLSGVEGLISLDGDNGMGKTTLLENLQPFRTLPSRKSTLKKHCYLKNSQKELHFKFNGDEYRTLVKMDPTTTVGDEGFIWKNGASVVDGKVTNFDKYLVELLGSQNLFFNSIFCAQNSSKLSDMRPAELKALFAEFLRLDRYVAWEDTAKAAARIYEQAQDQDYNQIEKLDIKIKMLGDPHQDLKFNRKALENLEVEYTAAEKDIEDQTKALTELKQVVLDSHIAQEKKTALERERDRLNADYENENQAHDNTITDLMIKSVGVEDEAREVEKTIEGKEEIEKAMGLTAAADKIIRELETKIENKEARAKEEYLVIMREAERVREKKQELELYRQDPAIKDEMIIMEQHTEALELLHKKLARIDEHPELVRLSASIAAMEKSAAILDDIDPACTSEVCGLITHSLDDKKALPAIRSEHDKAKAKILDDINVNIEQLNILIVNSDERIKSMTDDHAKIVHGLMDDLKDLEDHFGQIDNWHIENLAEIDNLKTSRREFIDKKARLKPQADKAAEIMVAEARLKTLNEELDKIAQETDKAGRKHMTATKDLAAQLLNNEKAISAAAKLIDSRADEKYTVIEAMLKKANNEKVRVTADIAKTNELFLTINGEIKQVKALEAEMAEIEARIKGCQTQQSEWFYIKDACSKDGLRALEIEGVAPVITGYANDMLTGTFGPNHSVRFETQDEDGREVLDIVVIGDTGSETLLSNLSGGESVWILKALRLAQTLISQEKSGRHFETALMDEEDGALSNSNAIKFISLYGTLMKMARMRSCFYISHRPDAINMADYQIKFRKGGVSIA